MTGPRTDAPRTNRDPAELSRKRALLREPHVAPLTAFVERLRAARGGGEVVPWFDPTEAGIRAPMLLLLEAPGARAVGVDGGPARAGSGFISPDNNDQTAANMWEILRDAGINRAADIVTWNVVPWYVGDGTRIRAVTDADRREARPALEELIGLLPAMRVVVVLGRAAAAGWRVAGPSQLPVIEAPHPSPKVLNIRPAARAEIIDALSQAQRVAGRPPAPRPAAPTPPPAAEPATSRALPADRRTGPAARPPSASASGALGERITRSFHEDRLERQAVAARHGVSPEAVERTLWEWEPRVYPHIRLRPEPNEVVDAREGRLPPSRLLERDNPRLRWDRIAARAGIGVADARRVYDQVRGEGASRRSYTGKGRRFEGMEG